MNNHLFLAPEDVGEITYRALALNVASTFASVSTVVNDPAFTSLILRIGSILKDINVADK
jgi:hypothetical protein